MDVRGVLRRGLALSVIVGAAVFAAPAQAAPSTVAISSNPAAPAGSQPFTITVSGDNESSSSNVGVQASISLAPHTCGPNQGSDSGSYVIQFTNVSTGSYSVDASPINEVHGTWVVCAWLYDNTNYVTVASTSLTLQISNPTSISLALSPSPTYPGRITAVSAQGNADEAIDVYVTTKPDTSGAACAPTPGQGGGSALYQDSDLGAGPWSDNGFDIPNLKVGPLLLCGWVLATGAPTTDATQVLATTQRQLDVLSPSFSLTLSAPGRASYFHTVTVTAKWHADTPAELFVTAIYRWRRACPTNRWKAPLRTSADLVSVDNGRGFADNFAQVGAALPGDPTAGTQHLSFPLGGLPAGTYVICGWLQQLPTGSEEPMSTPAVSGPVSLKIVLRPPITFAGRDSQGQRTRFTLSGRTIIGLSFYPHAACTGLSSPQWNFLNFPNLRAARNGAFSFVGGSPEESLKVRLHGHIYRRYASGWFTATWRDGARVVCHTGTVTFRFIRHGG